MSFIMFEKIFNDLWPQLKKQGLFVLTLLFIIYYFNGKVNKLEDKVDICNQQNNNDFLNLQKQTLIILDRIDLKIDMIVTKKINKTHESSKKYNTDNFSDISYVTVDTFSK